MQLSDDSHTSDNPIAHVPGSCKSRTPIFHEDYWIFYEMKTATDPVFISLSGWCFCLTQPLNHRPMTAAKIFGTFPQARIDLFPILDDLRAQCSRRLFSCLAVVFKSGLCAPQQPMKARMKRRSTQPQTPVESAAKPRRSRADNAAARRMLSLIQSGGDTRVKKVKRIRQSVRTRSYENELKLSIAVERLVRELSA